MQCTVFRPVVNYSVFEKQILRTITAASQSVVKEDTQAKPWTDIPGPSNLPILGPIHHFLPGGMFYNFSGTDITRNFHREFGPVMRLDGFLGKKPMLFLFDAESASQILRGENTMPIRPGFVSLEYYRRNVKKNRVEGQPIGLINDTGEKWKEFRTVVNPVMLQPKTIKLYASVLSEVAMEMVNRIKSLRDENNIVKADMSQQINLWALESIGVVALGSRLNCFDPNLPENSPAKRLIKCVHDFMKVSDALDFKPSLWRYIATPTYKKAMLVFEEQETLAKYFINQAIQEIKSKPKLDDEKGILEKLLEINEEYAYIMASDMLLAGVDTAANTVLGAMYLLAKNPVKQNKLREELRSSENQTSYLKACLKEAIRMMPVVGGNMRRLTKDYTILGYKIPANMEVAIAHQDMSMMEEHFPRPIEYIPERWLVDKNDPLYYRNAHPFAYNPFGFGVRSCIGRRIAELEMETFIARMVENFEMEWFGPPPTVVQTSLNYITGPFNFVFKDAK